MEVPALPKVVLVHAKNCKLLPPSPREGDREAVVGVSKVLHINLFDCIYEGTSSQIQSSHTFRPAFATPPVSFADSPQPQQAA